MSDPPRAGSGPRLSLRVFYAMALVVLAGAGTLILVSLMLGPAIFHRHLSEAGIADAAVNSHVEEGFALAALISTGVGVLAATAVAAVGAMLVARRLSQPIAVASQTAATLAAGDYSARMESPRMGPELAELADSVNSLAARLEETEGTRIRLMSDLAHELRTPVASIEATVEAITDQVLPADAETLATLTDQAERLTRLIDDLAAVSRAEERSFRLDIETVDLLELARASAAAANAGYVRAGVTLQVVAGPPATVRADRARLGEVLDQLLSNSLHHTRPGDQVTIAVRSLGPSSQLTVTDTGSGFDPAEAERIFGRFYRADPARANQAGTGIGLTIARALVQAQGGTLTATSPGPGKGAQLAISLPAATER